MGPFQSLSESGLPSSSRCVRAPACFANLANLAAHERLSDSQYSRLGSYPRLRCFRQNLFRHRGEVRPACREESRQVGIIPRREFQTGGFHYHVRVAVVFPPVVAESTPTLLPSEPQALDVQSQDVDGPVDSVGINGSVCASHFIGRDLAVETYPCQRRQRGQRPRIDKVGVYQALLGLTATAVAPYRRSPPCVVIGAPSSTLATGDHVCRVQGASRAMRSITSRNDVLDLPVLILDVDLAVSA